MGDKRATRIVRGQSTTRGRPYRGTRRRVRTRRSPDSSDHGRDPVLVMCDPKNGRRRCTGFHRRPRAGGRGGAGGRAKRASRRRGCFRAKSTRSSSTSRGARSAKCKTPVAIFATGGFGRGELAPFSDLDLLVLCAKTPGNDVQKLAEAILYPLWDAKVDAGHAVRAYDQALALPANDLAAATALLDARFLTGDRALADKFLARVPRPGREDGGGGLRGAPARRAEGASQPLRRHDLSARARPQERAGRVARPVRGPLGRDGALRDVRSEAAAGPGRDDRPAGAGVHGRDRVADARPHPDARDGGAAAGSPALRATGGDRADPVSGGARSRRRHPAGGPPGGGGADAPVPRSRQADSQRDRTPAAARVRARGQAPQDPAGDGARRPAGRQDGRRALRRARRRAGADRSDGVFERKPSEIIRIFQLAIDLDVPLALRTRELLGELAASQPALLRDDAEAGRRFVEMLLRRARSRQPVAPGTDAGPRHARRDHARVGAVDRARAARHLSRVHRRPARAVRGRAAARARSAAITRRRFRSRPRRSRRSRVRSRWRSGRCCTTSASRTAARTARSARAWRWRSAAGWGSRRRTSQRVEFLVRQHLVMGQMSQRRDLEDLGMISDFGAAVRQRGEPARAVPADLLRSRVGRARRDVELEGDAARRAVHADAGVSPPRPRSAGLRARRDRRRTAEGRGAAAGRAAARRGGDSPLAALFAGFPSRYFAENAETRIAAHVRLVRARREQGKSSLIDVSHDTRLGMTEMVLAAADTPGLLADVAGVLYANRIEVVDAAIYSRQPADPKEAPEALDVFRVRDSMGRPVTAEARWTKVSSDLEAVVSGRIKAEIAGRRAARARNRSPAGRRRRCRPSARSTTIVSRDFTVVEVITEDRPGVLYAIARALFVAGPGHPPFQDRHRGQPRHRRVLRARQGDHGEDHRPGAPAARARHSARAARGCWILEDVRRRRST